MGDRKDICTTGEGGDGTGRLSYSVAGLASMAGMGARKLLRISSRWSSDLICLEKENEKMIG